MRPLNLQARHATAVDGEVSALPSASLGVLQEALPADGGVEVEGEGSSEASQQQSQPRQRNIRRAKRGGAATTKPEELVEGAVFTGTVRTVTNYGAFVDIGAFTDGLVHISQLSDSYVSQVQDLVSVGQQVSVRILEADLTSGRISLSMRPAASSTPEAEAVAASAPSGSGTARASGERKKIAGRGANKPATSAAPAKPSVQKGQTVTGVVKNTTRNGIFLTLSTGDEGFLRSSDSTIDNPTNLALESLVEVGQELEARVQRIDARGKVILTQKKEVDIKRLNLSINNNEEAGAVNPFELAFRQGNFLGLNSAVSQETEEEVEGEATVSAPLKAVVEEVIEEVVAEDTEEKGEVAVLPEKEDAVEDTVPATEAVVEEVVAEDIEEKNEVAAVPEEKAAAEGVESAEAQLGGQAAESAPAAAASIVAEDTGDEIAASPEEKIATEDTGDEVGAVPEERAAVEDIVSAPEAVVEEVVAEDTADEVEAVPGEKTAVEIVDSAEAESEDEAAKSAPAEVVADGTADEVAAVPGEKSAVEDIVSASEAVAEELVAEDVKDEGAAVPEERTAAEVVDSTEAQLAGEAAEAPVAAVSVIAEDTEEKDEVTAFPDEKTAGEVVDSTEAQVASKAVELAPAAAALVVPPALVKELRQASGAGMMECKKALVACANDLEKAAEYLRKKGLASAEKKATRVAAEGAIGSYIHDGRIGVLIEVNSETDFVARGDRFKELVQDLAMQVAAYPQVQYVSVEDIPAEIGEAERKIEEGKDDLASKPEAVRSKIVEGRVNKLLKELSLVDQPYIRNDKVLVKDHIKETIAALGENLQVRRFKRFNLGEGIEKKKTDFAAEVAEQTKPKEPIAESTPQKAPEPQPAVEQPVVAVSAAAVKELRQATGAGMMECKKALAACENDLEKATEYLRKKGLASADKKASRVAAEGLIGKYIHDGRIGVLIEVNCETDFVARGERFKELVQDLAMQVVACPHVTVVSVDEVPADLVTKERELESQREDVLSKPEAVRSRILDGRIAKRLAELALLEQPYIRNDKVLVKDHIKETIAALGENIQVRRFVKFVLGEGIEKKQVDFAAEVAAQTKGLQP